MPYGGNAHQPPERIFSALFSVGSSPCNMLQGRLLGVFVVFGDAPNRLLVSGVS